MAGSAVPRAGKPSQGITLREVKGGAGATRTLLVAGVLVVVALGDPIAGRAQAPRAPAPRAKVRTLATIDEDVRGFVRLPSGRALIYMVGASPNGKRLVYTFDGNITSPIHEIDFCPALPAIMKR
jgi:hypothetical protein